MKFPSNIQQVISELNNVTEHSYLFVNINIDPLFYDITEKH